MLLVLLLIGITLSILVAFSFSKKQILISPKMDIRTNSDIYDADYANIYDRLNYDHHRLQNEVASIDANSESMVLDVGSGTGHLVHALQEKGIPAMGVDLSYAMIQQSKHNYKHRYIQGNALSMPLFFPESFTHITCFYHTLYYMKHKDQFFQNVYSWLLPEGKFIVHLVPTSSYGPVNFKSSLFKYKGRHVKDWYMETITTTKIRRNEHKFYMESIPFLVKLIKDCGFTLLNKKDSLYTFQRINF